ncbi:hypothetical protein RRSL_04437 [Ralstonia solanacearum UW551]|uniref:Uncharacterized protein n=1 Tax=Ralstonia solanacearum (strain UW551) TaxID=342110 RepID=A0AB33VKP2_RALSU|nr:hypothetical protein RRSL_04437 [Ralstonia solanacearum UW551]
MWKPDIYRRTAAFAAFFSSVSPLRVLFMAGRAGPASAGPVACRPVFHPRRLARHPSCGNERRAFPLQEASMLNAPARPEQPAFPQILAIVRTALRDAVAAPTDRASLDVAGAALLAVAAIVQARRHYG